MGNGDQQEPAPCPHVYDIWYLTCDIMMYIRYIMCIYIIIYIYTGKYGETEKNVCGLWTVPGCLSFSQGTLERRDDQILKHWHCMLWFQRYVTRLWHGTVPNAVPRHILKWTTAGLFWLHSQIITPFVQQKCQDIFIQTEIMEVKQTLMGFAGVYESIP